MRFALNSTPGWWLGANLHHAVLEALELRSGNHLHRLRDTCSPSTHITHTNAPRHAPPSKAVHPASPSPPKQIPKSQTPLRHMTRTPGPHEHASVIQYHALPRMDLIRHLDQPCVLGRGPTRRSLVISLRWPRRARERAWDGHVRWIEVTAARRIRSCLTDAFRWPSTTARGNRCVAGACPPTSMVRIHPLPLAALQHRPRPSQKQSTLHAPCSLSHTRRCGNMPA